MRGGARGEADVTVIGAGLAGCEVAWRLAARGRSVALVDMKPGRRTPAHSSTGLGELVCSNSLGSDRESTAAGLLKAELRRAGSLVMSCADRSRVPAGGALAVDRSRFSAAMTEAMASSPCIAIAEEVALAIPREGLVVVATGPMTAPPLSDDLIGVLDPTGSVEAGLSYWDAISPIVEADSVDPGRSFRGDRWAVADPGTGDHLNCPMDAATYYSFVRALLESSRVPLASFEDPTYYEGCLPIEVLAARGPDTLAHGPLRPVGLKDPATGDRPHAVIQLRREDAEGKAYNLVGCQTRMTMKDQERVFGIVPALAGARFMRHGQVHRNTFVDAPSLLRGFMESKARPGLWIAGQLSGVEGYTESTAAGLLVALAVERRLDRGPEPSLPPAGTACGGLLRHVAGMGRTGSYQPSGISWALVAMGPRRRGQTKKEHRSLACGRGIAEFGEWLDREGIA